MKILINTKKRIKIGRLITSSNKDTVNRLQQLVSIPSVAYNDTFPKPRIICRWNG